MSTTPPVRHAVLRDGANWAFALPASVRLADDDSIVLATGAHSAVLESGRLDAGIDSDWERVAVQAASNPAGTIELDTFVSADALATPAWRREPGLNVLLDRAAAPAAPVGTRRFLWLRITLSRLPGTTSPVLRQVQARTVGRSYLEDLPAVYRRQDRDARFLERWLDLFRSDMEGFEQALADVPSLFDPRMAGAEALGWIAQCLGFDPPPGLTPARLRALLQRVPDLYERRGTVAGLADWAEIYTGLRPTILEAFRARRVWQLGVTSALGFDTMLPAGAPDGLVVPGTPLTDPAWLGLLRETFTGPSFDRAWGRPIVDRSLNIVQPPIAAPQDEQQRPVGVWTLRWTGQIRPRHPERHTLSLRLEGRDPGDDIRLRFWIDGAPLVHDLWADAALRSGALATVDRVALDLPVTFTESRWHALRLEVRTTAASLKAVLSWSSRSQHPEVVPGECLYALADERADPSRTRADGFDVGGAVLGETGPQAPADFGQALFGETAHLFTVLVPPACDCDGERARRMREVIDAEKPAHTDYHLCFLKPRLRVGIQARLGIDAIVADGPPPARLGEASLGRSTFLAAAGPADATTRPIRPRENDPWTR